MKQRSIEIKTGEYSVFIGNNIFADLKKFLSQYLDKQSAVFVLCDENSMKHCYPLVSDLLNKAEVIIIPLGEENKNIDVCKSIWQTLSEKRADRKSILLNLGGGVIGDMGGFAASTFKRGIDFINIPTTLIAQADASFGGKTGINLNHIKNEIGVFNFPKAVFVYPGFLNTLSNRQLKSGFAEIIKHALIADKKYWTEIKSFDFASKKFSTLITRSIEIKNKIVKTDPKEKGIRKMLNFGHTIGHTVETFSLEEKGKTLLHGEAIAVGMVCETYLSHEKLGLPKKELSEITSFILKNFEHMKLKDFDEHRLIELMKHDKKNTKGEISFSLLRKIGKAEFDINCSIDLIKQSLKYYKSFSAINVSHNKTR